jgi:hypothetical protein
MFNNSISDGLSAVSDEELDVAMGPVDGKKPKAAKPTTKPAADEDDNDDDEKPKGSKKKPAKGIKPTTKKPEITTLSSKDADAAFASDDDDDDDENVTKKPVAGEDDDENVDPDEQTNDDDDNEEPEEEEEEDENAGDEDEEERIKDFLKARAEHLIKKGEWADWDGRDKTDWTEETFAEMELQQRQNARDKMREELLGSFGPYGKQIAEFSENGGDPDELIDIFKEEQRAQSLSIETEADQREVVFLFETQFNNRKPERARKYIDGLVTDKELANEAKEAKEKMEEYWANERETLVEDQKQAALDAKKKQKESFEKFSTEVTKFITDSKDIPDAEKQSIIKVLTKFDKKGPNGLPVNDFFFKFAEFKKDLPNYISLVRMVLNPKGFSKQLKNEGKTESVEKGFALIRKTNKSKKNKSAATGGNSSNKKSTFRLMY